MSKIRIDLMVNFETLQWLKEIQSEKRLKNLSQTMEHIRDMYLIMAIRLENLKKAADNAPESYREVRTEQIKEKIPAPQKEKPLHLQGDPTFFKKYPTLQDYWKEQERKKKEQQHEKKQTP